MTKFEPSAYAKLLSELDKHSGQNVEYWSKDENLPRWDKTRLWFFDVKKKKKRIQMA